MKENLERILVGSSEFATSLPESRGDFDANQLSITPVDRACVDSELGRIVADEVLRMQREQHTHGGINPAVNKLLFPDGINGNMDLNILQEILANHIVWRETITY